MTSVGEATNQTLARLCALQGTGTGAAWALVWLGLALGVVGCGTTKSFTATEQLLVSDAVDATVSKIDFRPLSGYRIYLDNSFLPKQALTPQSQLVHSDYVTSSLRQQMLAAGVLLCEKKEDADIIVEARLGALGFDGHSVTYGIPASSSLSTAASTIGGTPPIPLIPELSLGKKEAKSGAAKIALFAYERKSLQPVWQSGIARSTSTARDTWVLGVGPLQNGTIYEGTRFAGSRMLGKQPEADEPEALVDYKRSQVFTALDKPQAETETASKDAEPTTGSPVAQASASGPSGPANAKAAPAGTTTPAQAAATEAPPASKPAATQSSDKPATSAPAPTTGASPTPLPATSSEAAIQHIDDLPKK